MTDQADDHVHELWALRERAKELSCIYSVSAALSRRDEPPQVVFRWVLDAIPPAWQYPADTTARIEYLGRTHALPDFIDTPWRLRSPISVWRTSVGAIEVHYKQEKPTAWEGPFLREERELLWGSDVHVWILGGKAPAFVKSEGPLYVGGPIWRIELASPVWPAMPPPDSKNEGKH